jgi:hypothetical protein
MNVRFQYRKYDRIRLNESLGTGVLPVFEQFLEDQGFEIDYPIGWIMGYFRQISENRSQLMEEIADRVDSLAKDGCLIVFALLEWGDHCDRDAGIAESASLFSEMGWVVSGPFAATKP